MKLMGSLAVPTSAEHSSISVGVAGVTNANLSSRTAVKFQAARTRRSTAQRSIRLDGALSLAVSFLNRLFY